MINLDDRIILRKPEVSDADDLLSVKNNKEAGRLLGGFKEGYTRDEILKWIDFHRSKADEMLYVIYDITLQKVVGHVGLYDINHRIRKTEFGILIGEDSCRGKGYGSLCLRYMLHVGFMEMGMNRIELTLLDGNMSALNLYEKFGFKIEGVQRQAQYKNGRYYDIIFMSMLKDEYNI